MAIIKCKMCGGDLDLIEGQSVAECEYCGSRQTVPTADNEKKLTLFARANRLRAACEFDKAAGIYESIVTDFPEEAEAYWGLVLCKYGIEYVDDPATGKKIPTCHRSSYDSVMDDSNYEQAMENADLVAQKVYREEAKQIERIRKGILEVSSKEQPYDIFICYKETAPNGDRTLDSVLAQDLYSALTDKGYRVFFSRITLQGKLGEAYEPYIFAALNSAKVMLAVGTCYEYYNAVWVKNEWSRYLKICEADKSKHLIPCYKNLDPEDMPREFNHLQGADLGKMGAVQDILFNMEKYIPLKKQTTTVIQEKVVVGGSGNNKIASLLDRGNMALEDGDWAKADSFFEDVLNNDSKNAQAYLGKTLAAEKCRTIDAFARKRKDASQIVRAEKQISPNTAHIEEIVTKYAVPGYLGQLTVRRLYDYDLSYSSDVSGHREQYKAEQSYWANHKWLSKAEKFAVGTVAEHLEREKKALFAALSDRIKQAENAEAVACKNVQNRYDEHLKQANQKAEKLYQDALHRREDDYQKLLQIAKTSSYVAELTETAKKFELLGDYQDSKNLAEHCRKRAAEEQAKLDAEAERQRILKEKQEKARKAKKKMLAIISAVAVALVVAVIDVVTQVIIPGNNYKAAEALLVSEQYEQAKTAFEALGDYKDSAERSKEISYQIALSLLNAKEYDQAVEAFELLGDYMDSSERVKEAKKLKQAEIDAAIAAENARIEAENSAAYDKAQALLDAGDYHGAISAFAALDTYRDSAFKVQYAESAVIYQEAENLLVAGKDKEAALLFGKITDFEDAFERSLALRDPRLRNTLCVSSSSIIGLKNDGTVVAAFDSSVAKYQPDLSGWTDIIDLQRDGSAVAGLRSDGTVCAVGIYEAANKWTDIVQLVVGYKSLLGLKADGSVLCAGENNYSLNKFTDIFELHRFSSGLYGIKSDGSTVSTHNKDGIDEEKIAWGELDIWKVDSAGKWVGLKRDGTLTSEEVIISRQKVSVKKWNGLVDFLLTDHGFVIGVKEDGRLLIGGEIKCNISRWNHVERLYMLDSYTTDNLIALCSDGTVRIATEKSGFMDFDISCLTDIRVPDVKIQH